MEQLTEQVEQFITMLRSTGTQVEDGLQHVEADSSALDHLAEEVHDQLAGLGHELEGLVSELGHDEQEAASELGQLGDAAHAIGEARLGAALGQLEHAESAMHQTLEAARNELDHDAAGLHDQGFQPFAATLHSVDGSLDGSRSESEQAFSALETALPALTTELQAAAKEVEHSLIAGEAILGDEDRHALEQAAGECVAGLHGLGPELDGECGTAGEAMQHLYDGWTSEAEHEGHELEQALTAAYDGAADGITTEAGGKISEPAEQVETAAVPALRQELEEQHSMLEEAQHTAAELVPLAANLEITNGVIETIDGLVKSMSE